MAMAAVASVEFAVHSVEVTTGHASYPAPPNGFKPSPDVETMWLRYQFYRDQREPLLSMAYVCLSLLEGTTGTKHGARTSVCTKYKIDQAVRDKFGDLVSEHGDASEARKLDFGVSRQPLTHAQRVWIDQVVKALIRRKAEYDFDPSATFPPITMADFIQI
jgi:hypothetical protein